MTLDEALKVLAEAHTHDHDVSGFYVGFGNPRISEFGKLRDYTEAWKAVRQYLGMQVDPKTPQQRRQAMQQLYGGVPGAEHLSGNK